MQFPRLNDTSFPHLQQADPYAYQNRFDYSKWTAECRIKLLDVPWHGDYKHVVDWKTDTVRDAWFDSREGESIELQADSRRVSDSIPVPVTYQLAQRYNYCMLEAKYPDIDYSESPRRLYYFIMGLEYLSPNTTRLQLQLDYWTTYINHVSIDWMMLQRGHAPMDACTADAYLQDPLGNQKWLGAADVDYGNGSQKVASMQLHDFGAADKLVCFASVIPFNEFGSAVAHGAANQSIPASFSNESGRAGYQLDVSGFGFRTGYDFADARIPSVPLSDGSGNIPHHFIYGIPADVLASGGIQKLQAEYPYFIKSCAGCFIVPDDMVSAEFMGSKSGLPFYAVEAKSSGFDFALSKDAFGYDAAYADIAKLYSMPYAHLEFSDEAGRSFNVRIEDISGSTIEAVNQLNLAFPYLDWTVALVNIGSSGTRSVTWKRLDGSAEQVEVWESQHMQWALQLGIPTYTLLLSREVELDTAWASVQKARENAVLSYQSNAKNLNTARENVRDSNATMVTNTTNSGNTASANTALSVATSSANVAAGNQANTDITDYQRNLNNAYTSYDNALQAALVDIQRESSAATTSSAAAFGIGGGAISGAIQGGVAMAGGTAAVAGALAGAELGMVAGPAGIVAGLAIGGIMGAVSPSIQAAGSATNNNIVMTAKQSEADAAAQNNVNKTGSGNANASAKTSTANNLATTTTNNNNTLATQQNANNVALANTNASNISAVNNAQSEYSRNVSIVNAQLALDQVRKNHDWDRISARQSTPVAYGASTGDVRADAYGRRVFTMRVVTQGERAIMQAAAQFKRYGYRYDAAWEWNGWNAAGKPYSYWQASEVWLNDDSHATDGAKLAIDSILQAGTTVWKDADTIGKVGINGR